MSADEWPHEYTSRYKKVTVVLNVKTTQKCAGEQTAIEMVLKQTEYNKHALQILRNLISTLCNLRISWKRDVALFHKLVRNKKKKTS
jgi:hypothetical protein